MGGWSRSLTGDWEPEYDDEAGEWRPSPVVKMDTAMNDRTHRFVCPTCSQDVQLSNQRLAQIAEAYLSQGMSQLDVSRLPGNMAGSGRTAHSQSPAGAGLVKSDPKASWAGRL